MRLTNEQKQQIDLLNSMDFSSRKIAKKVLGSASRKSTVGDYLRNKFQGNGDYEGARILFFDVEISATQGHVWQLFNQNVGINQIEKEWHLLSWSAKWAHSDEILYDDQRNEDNVEEDQRLLEGIWKLLDECDIAIGHNSKRFDSKKLNARFIMNGMPPPSHYRQIDTLEIAKRHFGFTSNKLAWLTDTLCTEYKKMNHAKFPGFELWKECLAGNQEAWQEMEDYNKLDVLSLEELYHKLAPWGTQLPNLNLYKSGNTCQCGSDNVVKNGYHYTNQSVFQRYRCNDCGHQTRGKTNLLSQDKRQEQRVNLV